MKNRINQQFSIYKHRYKSRKALLNLNNSQLKDIGLTKEQAIKEATRPFWKGSEHVTKQKTKPYFNANTYETF